MSWLKDLSFGKKFILFVVLAGCGMQIYWAVSPSENPDLLTIGSLTVVLTGLMCIVIFCKKC